MLAAGWFGHLEQRLKGDADMTLVPQAIRSFVPVLAIAAFAAAPPALNAQEGPAAATTSATLKNADGKTMGKADLTNTPNGVIIALHLSGVQAGEHAFHVHTTGTCEAPSFKSAGGHFNPTNASHGMESPGGPHVGDMPNLHVPDSGTLDIEVFVSDASLGGGTNNLLDNDGAALVLHAKGDDYRTDPAGAAGDRIACGVITQ
jgi:superoxide dismutase, Cu-Zn family